MAKKMMSNNKMDPKGPGREFEEMGEAVQDEWQKVQPTAEELMRAKKIQDIMALSPNLDWTMAETFMILEEQGKLKQIIEDFNRDLKEGKVEAAPAQGIYKGMITIEDPEEPKKDP